MRTLGSMYMQCMYVIIYVIRVFYVDRLSSPSSSLSWGDVAVSPACTGSLQSLSTVRPIQLDPCVCVRLLLKGTKRKDYMCCCGLVKEWITPRPHCWNLPASLLPFSAGTSQRVADWNRIPSSLSVLLWGSGSDLKCGLFNYSLPC